MTKSSCSVGDALQSPWR